MPSYGYSLMCELYDPNELLAQAERAEAAGFEFLTISDHDRDHPHARSGGYHAHQGKHYRVDDARFSRSPTNRHQSTSHARRAPASTT